MRHVLVSYDGSAGADEALRTATRLGAAHGAAVTALAVVPPDASPECCTIRGRRWLDLLREALGEDLARAADALPARSRPRLEVRGGDRDDVVLATAEELGCDLILLPPCRRRRFPLRRRTAAERLSRRATAAVAQALPPRGGRALPPSM
jgi:nucleotide-binding universal stress UspA family protein